MKKLGILNVNKEIADKSEIRKIEANLAEYTEFMGKYTDTMTKFEAIEDSDMNDAETAYYIEVQTRINQKLLGAIQ